MSNMTARNPGKKSLSGIKYWLFSKVSRECLAIWQPTWGLMTHGIQRGFKMRYRPCRNYHPSEHTWSGRGRRVDSLQMQKHKRSVETPMPIYKVLRDLRLEGDWPVFIQLGGMGHHMFSKWTLLKSYIVSTTTLAKHSVGLVRITQRVTLPSCWLLMTKFCREERFPTKSIRYSSIQTQRQHTVILIRRSTEKFTCIACHSFHSLVYQMCQRRANRCKTTMVSTV